MLFAVIHLEIHRTSVGFVMVHWFNFSTEKSKVSGSICDFNFYFFWIIFKTLPFRNESTDFHGVWTVIRLGLLAFYWCKTLLL